MKQDYIFFFKWFFNDVDRSKVIKKYDILLQNMALF